MTPRFEALATASKRELHPPKEGKPISASKNFGLHVFNRGVMEKMLPKEVYRNVLNAVAGKERLKPEFSDSIAVAMKDWAMSLGATHYTHWFQPLTGASAEKHDAFIDWHTTDEVIEKFSGKQLIQGEPDASSFPSGGLRSTYEARGYTGWDPSSPVFVWKAGNGITLCIPSVFFSWTGDVLDSKIPLLRSEKKMNDAVLRMLRFTGLEASHIFSTVGLEQEYFVIDRALRDLRPDLLLAGRTVFGAPSPKGQELQDHYFGAVKERVLSYMHDFEQQAWKLGIPVKTRHNEVAPAQHEVAPVVEKASVAIDHNIQLMELMRKVALKHNLACLLHEKPFDELNGSGKHCNWSLATDTGINLLNPTDTPENQLHFLLLLTAILHAVNKHALLLRASVGSASNDCRLGGHEAPPAIISVYLGEALESLLTNLEEKGFHPSSAGSAGYDFGLHMIPDLDKDNTDRNRTSPFAFTGQKFEFRAVGSSQNPALAVTVLNTIVAESVNEMMDEIEQKLGGSKPDSLESLMQAVIPVIQKSLKESKGVRFSGDNYSSEWVEEAQKRNLPNVKTSIRAYRAIASDSTIQAFEGILNRHELESRYEIFAENYAFTVHIEATLMVDMFRTQILPAAMRQQKDFAKSISQYADIMGGSDDLKNQKKALQDLSRTIEKAMVLCEELEKIASDTSQLESRDRAENYCDLVIPKGEKLREQVDKLETMMEDALWPLPKYRELLFLV